MSSAVVDAARAEPGDRGSNADPLVVVSSDTHIGPLLKDQLRPYCPSKYLEPFDELIAQQAAAREQMASLIGDAMAAFGQQTEGHHDVHARLRDMDFDGVAAEVIFHGSQNGEPVPFVDGSLTGGMFETSAELAAVGMHVYNQWLADYCSVEPERHVGLAQLPMWDIDAAVAEVEWAKEAGLRGVNLSAPRAGITNYEDPAWEPFWSACEDLGMTLANHGGAGNPQGTGPAAFQIFSTEAATLSRMSPMNRMVYSGVFERHPGLRLVLTEVTGTWWPFVLNELDSFFLLSRDSFGASLPRLPSEYCAEHYFIGGSFHSRAEAEHAVEHGYDTNVMWGSDYPHIEGTFKYPASWDETPVTHLAMRYTYAGLPDQSIKRMLGQTALDVYGLDRTALGAVAERINAPTLDELAEPLAEVPERGHRLSFRQFGPWY